MKNPIVALCLCLGLSNLLLAADTAPLIAPKNQISLVDAILAGNLGAIEQALRDGANLKSAHNGKNPTQWAREAGFSKLAKRLKNTPSLISKHFLSSLSDKIKNEISRVKDLKSALRSAIVEANCKKIDELIGNSADVSWVHEDKKKASDIARAVGYQALAKALENNDTWQKTDKAELLKELQKQINENEQQIIKTIKDLDIGGIDALIKKGYSFGWLSNKAKNSGNLFLASALANEIVWHLANKKTLNNSFDEYVKVTKDQELDGQLIDAVIIGEIKQIDDLIKQGACIDAKNNNGKSLADMARKEKLEPLALSLTDIYTWAVIDKDRLQKAIGTPIERAYDQAGF